MLLRQSFANRTYTKLPSSTHFRCLLVALLDVLIVRLRRLLVAASVRLRMQLGINVQYHCLLYQRRL
jgi:hypothetical protein